MKEKKALVATPYIIEKCEGLTNVAAEPACHTAFTHFRAQVGRTSAAKDKKKVQCPFTLPSLLDKLRSGLLECSPADRVAPETPAAVSIWGCQSDMLSGGFEYMCMGNIRFTAKGSR